MLIVICFILINSGVVKFTMLSRHLSDTEKRKLEDQLIQLLAVYVYRDQNLFLFFLKNS